MQRHGGSDPEDILVFLAPWPGSFSLEGKRCVQLAEAKWFSPLGADCLSQLSPGVGDGGQSDVDPRLCGLTSVPSLPFRPGSSLGVNTLCSRPAAPEQQGALCLGSPGFQ